MLDGTITDRVEAESLNFNQNYIDIYSGSWGPDDTGHIYEGPGRMASEAFHKGATTVCASVAIRLYSTFFIDRIRWCRNPFNEKHDLSFAV